MAKPKSPAKKPAPKKPKGGKRAAAPTAEETVDVSVGSLLTGDNMPPIRDLEYHYLTILGLMDKASTAQGKVGDAKKKAKEAGVDVPALMNAMRMTRMDPLELAGQLRQQAAMMTKLGLPVQISLFEPKFGSIEAQAKAEGWAAGKAGRTPDMARWVEGGPGFVDYMRSWNDATADNLLDGSAEKAEEDHED